MILPDHTVVHKIGMCKSNRSTDRMMEILRSWFNKFRFVPYTELRLDMECHSPEKLEKFIHRILWRRQFFPNEKVSGGNEMFTDLDELRVITFLRSYNNSMYVEPPELSEKECDMICELLAP